MHNILNLGATLDTTGRKISLTFFSNKQYWDLICVKAEKEILHKYVMLNGRKTFNATSKIVGNSAVVPIQNSIKGFFGKSGFKFESLKSSVNSSRAVYGS